MRSFYRTGASPDLCNKATFLSNDGLPRRIATNYPPFSQLAPSYQPVCNLMQICNSQAQRKA